MRERQKVKRRGRLAAISAAVVALVTGACIVAFVAVAEAAPKTPTPSVPTGPSGPTASSTATFTFTDSASPVTFKCALDTASFAACTSPKTYSALAEGSHVFKVTATTTGKAESGEATRTWSVDTRPPTTAVAFPASGGSYNVVGWGAACSGGGVCGTATDATGVGQVGVSVLQQSSGKYWNGSSFTSTPQVFNTASGTTTWRLALAVPPLGIYTATVRATDTLGTTTASGDLVSVTFQIDTVAPPPPTFTNKPDNPTDKTNAQFNWTDAEPVALYRCSLDAATATNCAASGIEYKNLAIGDHCLSVIAVDAAGNPSVPAQYCWTIIISGGFQITGNAVGLLAPGASQPIDLVIKNPFNFPIKVTSVSITISPSSTSPGCSGTTNLTLTHSLVGTVTLPGNSTRSLSQLGTPQANWPLLTMPNLATNQDACKNTTFTLSYTGTAEKP